MTNVCVDSNFVIFRNGKNSDETGGAPASAEYWRKRESAERAAAKNSRTIAARRVHQELAQIYASRCANEEPVR